MLEEKYKKPFDEWHPLKKEVHERSVLVIFKEGQVWWCSVGVNVGHEIDGKGKPFRRPVLIVKKFSRTMLLAVPLTSKQRSGSWYAPIAIDGIQSNLVLSQVRVFDAKRLQRRIVEINETEFSQIKKQLGMLLGLR